MLRPKTVLPALVLALLAACGGDATSPSPTSASVAGAFTLRSIDGAALPFTVQNGANKVDVISSTLTMTDGGSWSETTNYRVSVNGGTPTSQVGSSSGSYARTGSTFNLFTTSNPNYMSGSFDGKNTLSMIAGGFMFVYSK